MVQGTKHERVTANNIGPSAINHVVLIHNEFGDASFILTGYQWDQRGLVLTMFSGNRDWLVSGQAEGVVL